MAVEKKIPPRIFDTKALQRKEVTDTPAPDDFLTDAERAFMQEQMEEATRQEEPPPITRKRA